MAILFSVVARRNIVLARHADCVGNFAEVTEQLLSKIESVENVRKTYSHGRYLYHYVCYNGLIFMCIAGNITCFHGKNPELMRLYFLSYLNTSCENLLLKYVIM